MNQERSSAGKGEFEGKMLLYSQPELLAVETHKHLGVNASAQSYDFVKPVRAIPVAAIELTSAQRNYPIVFTALEQPMLLAVVGVLDDVNLFVSQNGHWDESAYMPAYVRCHPFALAARPDDQYAVVFDRAAAVISENAEQPFFDGKNLTPATQARVDFCVEFDTQLKATKLFCNKLAELSLLSGQEVTFTSNEGDEAQSLGTYVAVDFGKLKELDADVLRQFHMDGTLAAIYAHRFSLDLWHALLDRRNRLKLGA